MYDGFVFRDTDACSVYEIYPQSEIPHLIRTAHLVVFNRPICTYLLLGTVIWRYFVMDRIVLNVWDYQLNHSITFAIDKYFDDYKSVSKFHSLKG